MNDIECVSQREGVIQDREIMNAEGIDYMA